MYSFIITNIYFVTSVVVLRALQFEFKFPLAAWLCSVAIASEGNGRLSPTCQLQVLYIFVLASWPCSVSCFE